MLQDSQYAAQGLVEQIGWLCRTLRRSIFGKMIVTFGVLFFASLAWWCTFNIDNMRQTMREGAMTEADRLGSTIKLGLHYAMLTYNPSDIREIIKNVSTQPVITSIRVYNKLGEIKYSADPREIDTITGIKAEACYVCHRTEPAAAKLPLEKRTRMLTDEQGGTALGVISPIMNEPACVTDACHVHPADKQILGLLDVVVSTRASEARIASYVNHTVLLTGAVAALTFATLFWLLYRLVNVPIRKMIRGTRVIAKGEPFESVGVSQADEMGDLARAIDAMAGEVRAKQNEIERQKDRYRGLFEHVPCYITVQNRELKLETFNRMFAGEFTATIGDPCYRAFKGRETPCDVCPVADTFADGKSHLTEVVFTDANGVDRHLYVSTMAIADEDGRISSVMEISLDISSLKYLEEELERSRKKYLAIFSNIPHSLFVLDRDSLAILECNVRPMEVYGYASEEFIGRSFLDLFEPADRQRCEALIRAETAIDRARHLKKDGTAFSVSIRVSTSQYPGSNVYLVSTSDITQRLETEQQLIQAGKMATLGEMATGVAHELNQPLTVMKAIGDMLARKLRRGESPGRELLDEATAGVCEQVERAAKIINHLREFGRKSDLKLEPVNLGAVLSRTFEFFTHQFTVRDIEVRWNIPEDLPPVLAEANRLEQVFLNLIVNARDAIEERWNGTRVAPGDKLLTLSVAAEGDFVVARIADTGNGIPPAYLEKVFEPFFTTKEVGKGTGLGLSISYGIIKDYGGTIRAESLPGRGATFVISLPRQQTAEGEP